VTEHHWFYVRDGRREGPVQRARLLQLARGGWLAPTDLVWSEGMPAWVPAGSLDWLFGGSVARTFHGMLDAAHPRPGGPQGRRRPARGPVSPLIDWELVQTRQVVGVAGLVAFALGVAFLAIDATRLAWGLFLGGAAVAGAGFHRELAPLLERLFRIVARIVARLVTRSPAHAAVPPSPAEPQASAETQASATTVPPVPRAPRKPARGDGGERPPKRRSTRRRKRRRSRRSDRAPPETGSDRGGRASD